MGYVEYIEIQVYIGCERDMIPSCLKEKGNRLKRIRALEMDRNVFLDRAKQSLVSSSTSYYHPSIVCTFIQPLKIITVKLCSRLVSRLLIGAHSATQLPIHLS